MQVGLLEGANPQGVLEYIAEPLPAAGAGVGVARPEFVECTLQADGQAPGEFLGQGLDNRHVQLALCGAEPVRRVIGQVAGLCIDRAQVQPGASAQVIQNPWHEGLQRPAAFGPGDRQAGALQIDAQ